MAKIVPMPECTGKPVDEFIGAIEKRVAVDILDMIDTICFGDEYQEFRRNWGSKGQRDLIIRTIQDKYGVI